MILCLRLSETELTLKWFFGMLNPLIINYHKNTSLPFIAALSYPYTNVVYRHISESLTKKLYTSSLWQRKEHTVSYSIVYSSFTNKLYLVIGTWYMSEWLLERFRFDEMNNNRITNYQFGQEGNRVEEIYTMTFLQ